MEALVQTVAQDEAYRNAMKHSDAQNARDESDRAAKDAIFRDVTSAMELYEAFMDDKRNSNNQSFSKWLLDLVFTVNYHPEEVTRVWRNVGYLWCLYHCRVDLFGFLWRR